MKYKPGAPKIWLYLTAGLMWSSVGLYLMNLTRAWVSSLATLYLILVLISGLLLGLLIYFFGFSKFADRNTVSYTHLTLPTNREV